MENNKNLNEEKILDKDAKDLKNSTKLSDDELDQVAGGVDVLQLIQTIKDTLTK